MGDTIGEAEVKAVFEGNFLAAMGPQSADRIRVLTALAIAEIGTPSLAKHLPDLLQEASPTVRMAAAKAVLACAAPQEQP